MTARVLSLLARQLTWVWPSLSQELNKLSVLKDHIHNKHILWGCLGIVFVVAGLELLMPLLLKAVVNQGIVAANSQDLILYTSLFCLITLLSYGAKCAQAIMSIQIIQTMVVNLRYYLITHILHLKASYHESTESGHLLSRATNDFDSITESLNHGVLSSIVDLSALIGTIIAMFLLDYRLALIGSIALPVGFVLIRKISRIIRRVFHDAQKKHARFNAFAQENIHQSLILKLLQSDGAVSQSIAKHHQHNDRFRNAMVRSISWDALLFSLIDGLSAIVIGLTLWLAVQDFWGLHNITPGVLVAYIQVLQKLFDPLKQIGSTISMLQAFFTSLERIIGILSIRAFIHGQRPLKPLSNHGNITFDQVYFRYHTVIAQSQHASDQDDLLPPAAADSHHNTPHLPWILENVSFTIPLRKTTAIVGATGSGKSTIIKLLIKLYDDYEGTIHVDGQDLREMDTHSLRRAIGFVTQDLVLFQGDVTFNISLERDGVTADMVHEAAHFTGAHRFISQWPEGYKKQILESGVNLSHGQKQLISLSRALCTGAEVIILDEATSAFDPITERDFAQALAALRHQKTLIIIAHKLATVENADQIIVVDQGKVAEIGTHTELLASKKHYYALIQSRKNINKASSFSSPHVKP